MNDLLRALKEKLKVKIDGGKAIFYYDIQHNKYLEFGTPNKLKLKYKATLELHNLI